MRIVAISLGTREQPRLRANPLLDRVIRTMVPAGSPDFEKVYGDVRHWWIEVDEAGKPRREIGFGADEQTIVVGPIGRNMGFWTDSPMTFDDGVYEEVSGEAFQDEWVAFVEAWEKTRPRG